MTLGRPFPPGNKCGRGRPKGSRNKRTVLARELLDELSPALVRKAATMALQGDQAMLRTLLPLIMPRPKDSPINIGPLNTDTFDDLTDSQVAVLKKVTSGQITPEQAKILFDTIETLRKLIENQDLMKRLTFAEERQRIEEEMPGLRV